MRSQTNARASRLVLAAVLIGGCARWVVPGPSDGGRDVAPVPPPGSIGTPCSQPSDCTSNVCAPQGVCSRACVAAIDCPADWTCVPGGTGLECACVSTAEVCDGRDNNCNGAIDDGLAGCPCPGARDTRCGAACVDVSSNRTNCGACGHACGANQVCADGQCQQSRLDLLVMVDNSNSMRENQSNLMTQFGRLLQLLTAPPCRSIANPTPHSCVPSDPGDTVIYPPVASLHVGVVSSDLGTPGSSVPGCANSDLGDDGLLNPIRNGQALIHHEPWVRPPPTFGRPSDCMDPNQFPSFIAFTSGTTDATVFTHDFQCNAGLYVGGCGLEAQLESVYRALVIHDATDHPGNTSPNAGFLRESATLAILMLTDEEDGSVRDCRFANGSACEGQGAIDVYNPLSTAWAASELNQRFYLYQPCGPQDPTWPISRYVDPANPTRGLLGLKSGHPERIVFAAITGVPLDLPMTGTGSAARIQWNALLGTPGPGGADDFCGRDSSALGNLTSAEGPISMMQANVDPNCSQRTVPACRRQGTRYSTTSCTTDVQYFAWPARRLVEVARRFDESPLCNGAPCRNGIVASVCGVDFGPAMGLIISRLQ